MGHSHTATRDRRTRTRGSPSAAIKHEAPHFTPHHTQHARWHRLTGCPLQRLAPPVSSKARRVELRTCAPQSLCPRLPPRRQRRGGVWRRRTGDSRECGQRPLCSMAWTQYHTRTRAPNQQRATRQAHDVRSRRRTCTRAHRTWDTRSHRRSQLLSLTLHGGQLRAKGLVLCGGRRESCLQRPQLAVTVGAPLLS